jgi:hypothetical protein
VTGPRRWWWRAAVGVLAFAGIEAAVWFTHGQADELRLALVVLLVVVASAVLLDASVVAPAAWTTRAEPEAGLSRLDPRTAAYLRIIEGHLSSREADAGLQRRLQALADQALRARRDLTLDDPRADELLGPEVRGMLTEAPRKLHTDEIERCVTRIEDL